MFFFKIIIINFSFSGNTWILNLLFLVSCQVVELISSAIGDVVQGLYYENCNNSEVKHLLSVDTPAFM